MAVVTAKNTMDQAKAKKLVESSWQPLCGSPGHGTTAQKLDAPYPGLNRFRGTWENFLPTRKPRMELDDLRV